MGYRPRARRVAVAGTRVRLADTPGNLINVSRTGALVSAEEEPPTGASLPLTLELRDRPVDLTARVVRTEPAPGVPASGSLRRRFAIALAFVKPSNEARTVLGTVCGPQRRTSGLHLGFCRVSWRRYCPRCESRSVSQVGRSRYTCEACKHLFVGIRIGPVRVAF
jgi:PilZ domain-containing protein